MARVRTVDFLPEIFQTSTNKQFLSATLDQLVQEPQFTKTQGFVGRRVGPGVNANDKYIVEPTKSRTNYQLEPGVIIKKADSDSVQDAITYPGISDALSVQGALTNDSNRLYTSDYYTWDPFVDFDKFVNFSQYYWLPQGPDSVDVSATAVPLQAEYTVTRANGVYTFSDYAGNNPNLTLVRGGNYKFIVEQNSKETVNFRVTNNATSAYVIDYVSNPTLTLTRGNTYVFNLILNGVYPFWIKTEPTQGRGETYNAGVERNGSSIGQITFTVPYDAPDTLYYTSENQFNMQGVINVVDATPGTGPGFWIQTDPGIAGVLPYAKNVSSRDVLGVINNGEDLGTVQFNVPLDTAQSFYYGLENIGSVDFVTNLKFNQINNVFLTQFIEEHGGLDGITNINGRTVVFLNDTVDAEQGGWQVTTQFDPLAESTSNNGFVGSFDTTTYDQTTDLTKDQRYSVWQIQYVTAEGGSVYIKLSSVKAISNLQKFNVLFGSQYATTQWYKDAEGYIQQIPLLTAIKDVLYYQDGTDPGIFGQIRLINQDQATTIDIDDIIGQKNYISPNGVVFTNGLKVQFRGSVVPSSYINQEYYVEGVGTSIKLLAVEDFVTPETYTESFSIPYDSIGYDEDNYDETLNAPEVPDYITINRASPDLNAWSRSNRWFHIDVIDATAEYNNTITVLDNNFRAKRPILEFHAGTRLFDFGTQGKQPVNIIDFNETDALSNINGSTGYGVDGYEFIAGTRVIFAADLDPQVRNKVYEVTFITPDTQSPLIAQPIINLVPADDVTVLVDQTVVCLNGLTLQGKSFYYDGVEWLLAQEKTSVNQSPLFNIYDANGISFADRTTYPSSTFAGNKLFSYAIGAGAEDTVLGFPLRYLSLTNVGDIVFDNNLYTDTFVYVVENNGITYNVSNGFVRQYSDREAYSRKIGWEPAATKSLVRQQFQFSYDGSPLQLDVKVNADNIVPSIQLYVASSFVNPSDYTVTTTNTTTTITLSNIYTPGDVIEIDVLSDQISATGFYVVPENLENNPFNVNSPVFTLGTVRTHYETIGENLLNLVGPINGANNTRDLGNIGRYGTNILQQSSPMTLAGFFMRDQEYDIFKSLEFNDREYTKFKNRMLETTINNEWGNFTAGEILDAVVVELSTGKTEINSFYWSDMLPSGSVYTENKYTVTPISTSVFDTVQTYNFSSANYLGLLVYLNGTLLTLNYGYTVATDGPRLTILLPLAVGDVVTIREYTNTAGSFVPNTPTKLGLYNAYKPEIFVDTNYVNPTTVIRGHDGSITVAFGDIRDDVLLEFERRIFNNLKTEGNSVPLTADDVIPGYFRTTDYTAAEITTILSENFLTWVGWNKLDYKTQNYVANNAFTYNYSQAGDKEKNQPLLGAWRGISRFFYDTLSPNTTPWEMLGFSQQPDWWEERYGPAPYTENNLVLWDDLQSGYVADPITPYVIPNYARPNLSTYFIPTGPEGELLPPLNSVVGQYDPNAFRKSWVVGDGGPVEAAWWTSSSYPFAVMRLLALTRPAEFFALFADRDLYKFDEELEQYLYNGRYRLDANGIQVYGNGVSKASYINWIIDYNQQLGRNSTTRLEESLASLDVRLCYRMASFSDKQYLKVYTERSSPNSLNSSLLLPDESYSLLLYKNVPFDYITYSSVIVQRTATGYSVTGYSTQDPYFNILASQPVGVTQTVSAGGVTVSVPRDYTNNVVSVPYGFNFTNQTVVVDFLLSYGKYLEDQGLIFDDRENGYTLNWMQMAQEFLYWANQGWEVGSVINLNPAASKLVAEQPGAVVDNITVQDPESMLVNQNRQPFDARNLVIERLENRFSLTSVDGQAIAYVRLKFVSYEHLMILDNLSIFNDLIYDPATGARQSRINLVAVTSTEWNGTLDAQGFILNQNNINEWAPNRKYAKGEIVTYKNIYWSAQTIVQPKLEFNYSDWTKSDWTKIQKGLLPNLANKADQLANSYSIQTANIDQDNDLLSYGLIGFRPREYMAALNLDDVSQVNLYSQFLGTKGTVRAAEIFTGANLGKEVAQYDIYENWAVKRGTYGANANRSYYELRLNEALLQSDPATIQVVQPEQFSLANQTVLLSDVWRQSYKLPNTDILPTTTTSITDTALPSAGYVNIDDVDITVFSLDDPSNIAAKIDQIGIGAKIWVAKTNSYDWDVYRCEQTPGFISTVSDNLDGTSLVSFTKPHNLARGDLLIIRFFNSSVNGVYRVLSTPKAQTLTIAYTFPSGNQTVATGAGLAFFLQTMRVAQASDVATLPYANDLVPGALAWVDNNGDGLWEVLEKQEVFSTSSTLTPFSAEENSGFGKSVAQATDNVLALVGSPDYVFSVTTPYNSDGSSGTTLRVATTRGIYIGMFVSGTGFVSGQFVTAIVDSTTVTLNSAPDTTPVGNLTFSGRLGIVNTYLPDVNNNYTEFPSVFLSTTGTIGFGNDVAIGDQTWAIIGASESNNGAGYAVTIRHNLDTRVIEQTQLLTAPDLEFNAVGFGTSVDISKDERWMYVSSPGVNRVYAYGRVDIENQSVTYVTDGITSVYQYNDNIVSTTGANEDQIIVLLDNEIQILDINYTINDVNITFASVPTAGQTVVIARRQIVQLDYNTYYNVGQNSTSGVGTDANFTIADTRGVYTATLTSGGVGYEDSDTLTILGTSLGGATPANDLTVTVVSVDDIGAIETFTISGTGIDNVDNFDIQQYLYTATNIYSFSITVNGVLQRPEIDYDFNTDNSLQFYTVPAAGATIVATSSTYWQYIDSISVAGGLTSNAQFGSSVATTTDGRQLFVGTPNDSVPNTLNGNIVLTNGSPTYIDAGSAYVFDRSVLRYQISDATQTTFPLPVGYKDPVAVLINGAFLTNTDQFINGQFTVSSGNVILSAGLLAVGDIVEIESNIFSQVQKISQETTFDEADFGYELAICPSNCSLYIGAPQDGTVNPGSGSVQRNVNQSRVYGITSSTIANPTLVAGHTLRINNYEVSVPVAPNNNVAGLVAAINGYNNGIGIPNVLASASTNPTFRGDGLNKVFNIGTTYSQYDTYNTVVYLGTATEPLLTLQVAGVDYNYNNTTGNITFTVAPSTVNVITVVSGILTLSIKNSEAAITGSKLTVLPGLTGSAFDSLGFDTFAYTQTIVSPNATPYAEFGSSVAISTEATNLAVGAPRGNLYQPVTFDSNKTYFDDRSTTFFTELVQSGVAYTFDYLPSGTDSITNPGKFAFGQQIYNSTVAELDQFGTSVNYTSGRLLVGAPGSDLNDSSAANFGQVSVFNNPTLTPAWTVKHLQQPVVDIALMNSVFMYDKLENSVTSYLDFFNPLQGKILGVARQNIDYIGAVDPANYNVGPVHNNGAPWGAERVGEIWWDTNEVRFIDPNQDDIVYASRRWGQLFPGSRVDIYQWIESDVAPANYTGPGTVLSTLTYTTRAELNADNIFATRYYFWVRNISTVNTVAGKKLSTTAIANYITNPRASGIAYLAPLNASTVAIYNVLDLISAQDTILHIEFDREANEDNVHVEYELIAQDRADAFLSDNLYLKLQDSLCGTNVAGAPVPDPSLSPAEQYGVEFRPRQSMFSNRFSALQNYLGRANTVLAQYPISETRKFNLLNSSEPEPTSVSGAWNKRVANLEELSYQNLSIVPIGYKYLVASDSSNNGLWTIYELVSGLEFGSRVLTLIRVQNYDTKLYWNYINWYQPGYNNTINPVAEVPNYSSLDTLTTVTVGASVKVTANAQGKFEIYLRTLTGWDRVGLEDGTIEFKEELWNYVVGNFGFDVEVFDAQYFDQEPVIETRKIIQAINEELFIDELAIERNRALILLFNVVLSEFEAPDWLIKTSLIDVDHKIRDLVPYQIYRQDNQDFVLDYIQEVKPYHTQIREFNLNYDGFDSYDGMLTDFDVPAFFDTNLTIPQFISPVLLPYTQSTANSGTNFNSDTLATSTLWETQPWTEWYNNYLLSIQDVIILDAGIGYSVAPEIVVSGTCIEPAQMSCIINSAGNISQIVIDNPGSGYSSTATITFVGGNGSGARAAVVMGNDLVRSIKTTIKYDRYQYSTTIVDWEAGINYDNGTQVRYADRVWEANSDDSTGVQSLTFDPADWSIVNAATLSGVDRTMGLYISTANQPGLELPLLIDGIDYPGVQVYAPGYDAYPGFDLSPFDSTPFDNLEYGPEGRPTYDQSILDAIYESPYLDPFLGTRATDINVEGGAYIDTYSSHAPEELIPGSEFDTLDIRVYTTPGADWANNGHGFRAEVRKYACVSGTDTFSFVGLDPTVATILVANQTTKLDLLLNANYTVDYVAQTVTLISGASPGDVVAVTAYEIGGANQLLRRSYNGNEVGQELIVPVQYSLIQEMVIFVNGSAIDSYTYSNYSTTGTRILFDNTYTESDYLMVGVIGPTTVGSTTVDYSWSTPVTQYITSNGSLNYVLTNSLEYTNPDNLIVTVNGLRARTSAGATYYADGSTEYALPERLGFNQSVIAPTEVRVYLDDILQVLGVDYTVSDYDPAYPRTVIFTDAPANGERILIYVVTNSQAWINGNQLFFNAFGGLIPAAGDIIAVTTWNDTRQQDILTQVFVGPNTGSVTVQEGYDETFYDSGTFNNLPGSFDYADGQQVTLNNLTLSTPDVDPDRLWVTLNGRRLFVNDEFTVLNNELVLSGGTILNPLDTVMVTEFTNSIAPNSMAFRIFQDMRGVQATYRITPETTTYLTTPLLDSDNVINVYDANALSEPSLENNIWGILTVNGERIMYRERNLVNNTVSGLLRGTAGTAAANHLTGSLIYNMSRDNLLPVDQNYVVKNSELANGTQTTFIAADINFDNVDSTSVIDLAVEVYVGGTQQLANYTITNDTPVTVEFDTAPAEGSEVTILVRQGVTWYAPGAGTPSDGVALQDTNTEAARFLRGEI